MLVGKKEYGTWKDGSSIYKDSKGYYIVAVRMNGEGGMYKKYLKSWKPAKDAILLCFTNKRWTECKGKQSKRRTTRKN